MKGIKKLLTGILAATMIMGASVTAFAQDVTVANGSATINISNAAKGETYKIYKLFDATVTGTDGGSIAYSGDIPTSLAAYFSKDNAGNISATTAAFSGDEMSDGLKEALKTWADGQQSATAEVVSDGSALSFTGLDYGYYVVSTTQGDQAITVDSTNPNAQLVDKNSSTPVFEGKTVDDTIVYIGQRVNYTVKFKTSNYDGAGTGAELITSYYIQDTLPDFLADVTVDSIVVDDDASDQTTDDQTTLTATQFDADKKIVIPWVDGNRNSLYKNGAEVIIKYSATVTKEAAIAGTGNTNHVDFGWNGVKKAEDEETIYTYALAIKKVDQNGNALPGATFRFPFAVEADRLSDGSYVYAGEGSTEITTKKEDGSVIVVRGLVSDAAVTIEETVAPNGYNKLTQSITVTPQQTTEVKTHKTWLLDENGDIVDGSVTTNTKEVKYDNEIIAATVELVVNKTGNTLPSTGGIGTTIFYIIGGILIIAGVAYFMLRRKADAE